MVTVPTPPLAVDLDGSLARTDTLWETLFTLVRDRPFALLAALASLRQGRGAFKARLVTLAPLEVASLPLNTELIDWLRQEGATGRRLVLATATHRRVAQGIADRVGLFAQILASNGHHNLKGPAKAAALVTHLARAALTMSAMPAPISPSGPPPATPSSSAVPGWSGPPVRSPRSSASSLPHSGPPPWGAPCACISGPRTCCSFCPCSPLTRSAMAPNCSPPVSAFWPSGSPPPPSICSTISST